MSSREVFMKAYQREAWQLQGSDPLGPGDEAGANDDDMSPLDPTRAPDEANVEDEQGNEPI